MDHFFCFVTRLAIFYHFYLSIFLEHEQEIKKILCSALNLFTVTVTVIYQMLFATGWSGDTTMDFLVGGESFRNSLIKLAGTCKSLRNICKY